MSVKAKLASLLVRPEAVLENPNTAFANETPNETSDEGEILSENEDGKVEETTDMGDKNDKPNSPSDAEIQNFIASEKARSSKSYAKKLRDKVSATARKGRTHTPNKLRSRSRSPRSQSLKRTSISPIGNTAKQVKPDQDVKSNSNAKMSNVAKVQKGNTSVS